jgi:putative ATPase
MDLFEYSRQQKIKEEAPLAQRLRPSSLDEFVGQGHILGEGRLLRRAILADRLTSIIFYGPPGSGKTTLAQVIANSTKSHFEQLNAVMAGVADLRRVVELAKERWGGQGKRTVLFIDEIHRFNKAQQDALLPYVEDGTVILVGATTENPFFQVIPPLVSRSRIFKLEPLKDEDIRQILKRALSDPQKGLGQLQVVIDNDAFEHIVTMSGGDARVALNALELAVLSTNPGKDGNVHITLEVAQESIQRKAVLYDKQGDNHYDTISAFIKSMRGSDPDAALFWLAKMLYAGEDPVFIARRIVICASEDVGNADPQALIIATATANAVQMLGMPEGRIPLAQAVVYISCAPKSNSCYVGINNAMHDVATKDAGSVPVHLRDSNYQGAKNFGHGKGYLYPHDFPDNYVKQLYLPERMSNTIYYTPTENGYEAKIKSRLDKLRPL